MLQLFVLFRKMQKNIAKMALGIIKFWSDEPILVILRCYQIRKRHG